jgi:ATP-dependent helicase/nuclease subunit A
MLINLPPTLIRASAGTGKTYRLTNRLIGLLAAGEKVERVLATTFTKKAAAEILERLLLRVAQASLAPSAAAELGAAIDQPNFSQQDAVTLLQRIAQSQHRLQISTLDSFFARIAKSFPLELGLPLAWEIADPESEADLRAEALDTVFQANKNEQHRLVFLSLLQATQGSGVGAKLYRILDTLAQDMYAAYRGSAPSAWQRLLLESGEVSSAEEVIAALRKLELPLTAKKTPHSAWFKDIEKLCNALVEKAPNFEALLKGGISAKIIDGEAKFSTVEIPPAYYEAFEKLFSLARASLRADLQVKTKALYDFLCQFDLAFSAIKTQRGVLLFDDVKYALLRGGNFETMEEIYFRLDSSLRHILLDEFQDTSLAEWSILHPFAAEVLASADGEHSFFCVGDVKQAIYGWRGGESRIFEILKDQFSQLQVDSMDVSYRSSPVVIDVVNKVFGQLGNSQLGTKHPEVARYWSEQFAAHGAARQHLPGFVTLDVVSDGSGVVSQRRELADQRAVELVQQVRRENPTPQLRYFIAAINRLRE